MTLPSLQRYGLDPFVLLDLNDTFMLLLAPIMFVYKKFSLKSYLQVILIVVLSSAVFGLMINLSYLASPGRKLTWNETFFADAIILSIILIQYLKNRKAKKVLIVCTMICFLSMIFTQTRSIWLSCIVCVAFFFIVKLFRNFKKFATIFVRIAFLVIILVVAQGLFNNKLTNLITERLYDFKVEEVINPASSTGYRIYESYMVIRNASWFGHGSGSRLHLVDTQGEKKWHDWWSIHCEYFEIIHKYGYVGLGIFFLLLSLYFYKSFILVLQRNSLLHTIGLIALLIMLQHCIISVTSGYIIRDDIVPFLALLISLVETGWYRRKFYKNLIQNQNPKYIRKNDIGINVKTTEMENIIVD
jgi:O-antigen ligase